MAKGQANPENLIRKGLGRKPGSKNIGTIIREQEQAVISRGITPMAYMLGVMRNPKIDAARRDRMAAAVAPYVHPRLVATTISGDGNKPVTIRSELDIGRRLAFVLELIARGELKAKIPDTLELKAQGALKELNVTQLIPAAVRDDADDNDINGLGEDDS